MAIWLFKMISLKQFFCLKQNVKTIVKGQLLNENSEYKRTIFAGDYD